MSKQHFEAKQALFESMNPDQFENPGMPVEDAIQEAEDLSSWCPEDKEKLEKAGLDWQFVTDLPVRIGACREAESIWNKEQQVQTEAGEEWKKRAPEAFKLRDEMQHHFLHAYRNNDGLYARVQAIAEGNSNADMIQDLNDMGVLGEEHPEQLSVTPVDETVLAKAKTWSAELGALLGKVNGDRNEKNPAKIMRDKAYSHMQEAVGEIRYFGQYVFWRTPERKKGYVSKYNKKFRKGSKSNKDASENLD